MSCELRNNEGNCEKCGCYLNECSEEEKGKCLEKNGHPCLATNECRDKSMEGCL